MSELLVTLPDPVHRFVQDQAVKQGYSGADEYVRALIDEAWTREEREQIEAKLLEGLASPIREVTSADWEKLRQRIINGDEAVGG